MVRSIVAPAGRSYRLEPAAQRPECSLPCRGRFERQRVGHAGRLEHLVDRARPREDAERDAAALEVVGHAEHEAHPGGVDEAHVAEVEREGLELRQLHRALEGGLGREGGRHVQLACELGGDGAVGLGDGGGRGRGHDGCLPARSPSHSVPSATMDLTFTERETAFRDELRAWFAANRPGEEPVHDEDAHYAWRREFQRRLAQDGLAAVHWPPEYGGRGATLTESAIFFEELGRSGAPLPANVLGVLLAGPTIMAWGTPEQKERYLAPILSADEIWCQGFSEPDAGSDLAALKTRAVKDGDEWVVTGQKVWTSAAQHSKWCMLVARTDGGVAKNKGLTYFLMDMHQPGVTVRPLRQITGEAEFNELFLEEVRIPDANVVGGVGNGWKVALTTLMNGRAGLGFALQVRLRQLLDDLIAEAGRTGQLEDPIVADALAQMHVRTETIRLLAWKGLTDVEKYGQPGPEGSLVKWLWSDTNQKLTQLAADVIGPEALTAGTAWSYELLRARGNTIEGGTTEILKNIVAERVLGLPRLKLATAETA